MSLATAKLTITYDRTTHESAEDGDHAERGYYMPGGWYYPTPCELVGPAFGCWVDETGPFHTTYTADDYSGDLSFMPVERGIAQALIYDGWQVEEDATLVMHGSWDDNDHTEDGEPCICNKTAHIEGANAAFVRALVRRGDAQAYVPASEWVS